MKNFIRTFRHLGNYFLNDSYSQEGEDLVLRRMIDRPSGFYVDIGAHHPKKYSNTFWFYKQGWRGLNIDAMPGSSRPFNESRPRDINIEVGIGQKNETVPYYMFDEPALNTFSRDLADSRIKETPYKLIETKQVQICSLAEVLSKYVPSGQVIDFFSIDVEGFEQEVLQSNDWEKFRPTFIVVEVLGKEDIQDVLDTELTRLLVQQNYFIRSRLYNSVIFQSN